VVAAVAVAVVAVVAVEDGYGDSNRIQGGLLVV
jgi:hypothetical protein